VAAAEAARHVAQVHLVAIGRADAVAMLALLLQDGPWPLSRFCRDASLPVNPARRAGTIAEAMVVDPPVHDGG
jgi:hypothetical protein